MKKHHRAEGFQLEHVGDQQQRSAPTSSIQSPSHGVAVADSQQNNKQQNPSQVAKKLNKDLRLAMAHGDSEEAADRVKSRPFCCRSGK